MVPSLEHQNISYRSGQSGEVKEDRTVQAVAWKAQFSATCSTALTESLHMLSCARPAPLSVRCSQPTGSPSLHIILATLPEKTFCVCLCVRNMQILYPGIPYLPASTTVAVSGNALPKISLFSLRTSSDILLYH